MAKVTVTVSDLSEVRVPDNEVVVVEFNYQNRRWKLDAAHSEVKHLMEKAKLQNRRRYTRKPLTPAQ